MMQASPLAGVTRNGAELEKDPRAQARDVAGRFEALFVQQMVSAMRTSAAGDGGGMFGQAAGADTYAAWFDSCMAEHIGRGGGIGLATMIEKNILQHQGPPQHEEGSSHA
jgi:Rod binding domain-containing protein